MSFVELIRRLFAGGGAHAAGQDEARPAAAGHERDATDISSAGAEAEVDPFNPFPDPVRLEITDVFDLHTFQPREVRAIVEEYLREAHRLGFRQVRIIHGKGVGVQRELVRTILARTPFVTHFSDAPPEAGGWGATIARLSVEERRGD
jgi:dsDNA-specific endonuclease/ATPase MutS2